MSTHLGGLPTNSTDQATVNRDVSRADRMLELRLQGLNADQMKTVLDTEFPAPAP